jgi:excinuclease ABC subunit A
MSSRAAQRRFPARKRFRKTKTANSTDFSFPRLRPYPKRGDKFFRTGQKKDILPIRPPPFVVDGKISVISPMSEFLEVIGAKTHNLKNVRVKIPKNKLVTVTGVSGSGKSSFAFDTVYAEGQRRYLESLSTYARMIVSSINDDTKVDEIRGLSPTISIHQKTVSSNPRSTVGTITEIYDFYRLLFTTVGIPYCPEHPEVALKKDTVSSVVELALSSEP